MSEKYITLNNDYPEFEKYLNDLDNLSNYDFSKLDYDGIYNKFHDLAMKIPALGASLDTGINGFKLFRSRVAKTIGEFEDKTLIQTFSFPPSNVCKYNGRANIKNKSVFYCTDDAVPALKENNIEINDEVYLSIWNYNSKRNLTYVCCLPEKLPENNSWNKYGNYHHKFLIEKQNEDNENLLKYKVELRNFITQKFMKEEYPYSITSMLANEYLYESGFDMIMYPSAKTYQDYTNFAIHPNVVLNHIELDILFHIIIIDITDEQIKFKVKSIGYLENDKINWRKSNDDVVEKHLRAKKYSR
jgi:hypothetical protein